MLPTLANEPMLAIEQDEPMLAMDSTEPWEPMDRNESVDHRDQLDRPWDDEGAPSRCAAELTGGFTSRSPDGALCWRFHGHSRSVLPAPR